ncbi:hypothetical protein ACFFSY_19640 [Paenibacillus aurantiacus]|uniref:Uncharacterized protein n=1 Tax=Paenibacillus aurantiacus TaxID=1936118 RepID=A0ABV5KVR1_9BACL
MTQEPKIARGAAKLRIRAIVAPDDQNNADSTKKVFASKTGFQIADPPNVPESQRPSIPDHDNV